MAVFAPVLRDFGPCALVEFPTSKLIMRAANLPSAFMPPALLETSGFTSAGFKSASRTSIFCDFFDSMVSVVKDTASKAMTSTRNVPTTFPIAVFLLLSNSSMLTGASSTLPSAAKVPERP
eukprot:CAMPEP_0196724332 /NCGR_PEP_ID=MMETSP1091-20130531/6230_1 /TAXON_ID=302021 /ORGANISM="Rhodomonas sp., Strain CCMP768" /LENGTH=120 /DNA_ID=CAMNT_0042066441 /DNA_START=134 /DNA_END=496 /DNA_ORIENTATION=+